MHELGVVFHIIDTVKEIAASNEVERVSKVTLELGEVSSVIPSYLTDCWKWAAAKEPLLEGAELAIETIPAINFCRDCGEKYSAIEHGRTCPKCSSGSTHLLQGNEFIIKEIEIPELEE